ncbi:hypothetical protein [Aquamicrobium soli]|uniref:DUF1376 domain-containing protein n=1 Tax=Aquamicrobium soli TaxID=1811518 RepID=A0ABV7KEU2_9HYPH
MSHSQLKVRNWEQFQHYKDRNPPWIKLHFALLASEDWVTLDDASKLLAVVCMLVASRNNGFVPNNPAYLKRVAYLDRLPKLKPLIECGFLEIPQADASTMQAPASAAQADARPETETDTEQKDSLSETSSDNPPKPKKKTAYPDAFEAFWKAYPRTPNMSKLEAFQAWQKLDDNDRALAQAAIAPFKAFLRTKPDLEIQHACRFISKRRFEGFVTDNRELTDEQWQKRLAYSRREAKWSAKDWGPVPGQPGCIVPSHLLQQGDGHGWREPELAA